MVWLTIHSNGQKKELPIEPMALRNQPYLPLFVDDYLADEKLNQCTAATQGIYIKLLCLMHKSDPYGTILLKQKYKQTDKQISNFASQLARNLLFTESEIEAALGELIAEKVVTLEGDNLFQKRMIHDNDISEKRKIAGSKGGEKSVLLRQKDDFAQPKKQANTGMEWNGMDMEYKENINMGGDSQRHFQPAPVRLNERSASLQEQFQLAFDQYPRPEGKEDAYKAYLSTVHNESDAVECSKALQNYLRSERVRKGFIKAAWKFFSDWQPWVTPTPEMVQTVDREKERAKERERQAAIARKKKSDEEMLRIRKMREQHDEEVKSEVIKVVDAKGITQPMTDGEFQERKRKNMEQLQRIEEEEKKSQRLNKE